MALLPSGNDLSNGMPYNGTCLFGLLLRQPTGDAHLQCGYGLPASVSRVNAQSKRESLQSCDQNTVCKTL